MEVLSAMATLHLVSELRRFLLGFCLLAAEGMVVPSQLEILGGTDKALTHDAIQLSQTTTFLIDCNEY